MKSIFFPIFSILASSYLVSSEFITTLSKSEVSSLDGLVATLKPGPHLNFSNPEYAPLVNAILYNNYSAPQVRKAYANAQATLFDISLFDQQLDLMSGVPVNDAKYQSPKCETSSGSADLGQAMVLYFIAWNVWHKGWDWCDQKNAWPGGSHCTNLMSWETAQFDVCGAYGSGEVRCDYAIEGIKRVINACRRDSDKRVGGQIGFWTSPPNDKPHKRMIVR
ncbi:hypothetical protein BJ508DRAFT_307787 [Ascobolus immersus RN42]|uniref:SCP domain-containing protein n=1 Tax=Ascobolus immersus RN42 TaxID=1160509 RepID=A0A3N4I1V3_ASCIM|nr:hypothetical protein BJ508DRAFT_307787 [Ascobolus immersus RN42]